MVEIVPQIRSIIDRDGAVILDIPRNFMTTLNSTGAYVWERLQRGMPVDAIVAELARDTGADESVIAKDVDEFMQTLQSKHLLRLS